MPTTDLSLEHILANTYTTSDAYKRLLVLEDVLQHSLFEKGAGTAGVQELLKERSAMSGDHGATKAVAAWNADFLSRFKKESLNADMQTLKNAVEQLPKLIVYAPVVFDAAQIQMIGTWCRKNIDPKLLLDMRIDPEAGGGCMFVWRDTLHDFSLRYFLKKRRAEFAKIMSAHTEALTKTNPSSPAR